MSTVNVEEVVRTYIGSTCHMSLATVMDGKPWVCEVHFAHDEDLNLYFISAANSRHCREISDNPNVAGNIVKQHELTESPNGIYFEGSCEVIAKPSDTDIDRYVERLMRDRDVTHARITDDRHKMYKITVKNWFAFGKFDGEKNDKYELVWNGGIQ